MSRAARRRAEREAAKTPLNNPQMIRLENPVTAQFESFIVGNAAHCDHVVVPDSAQGKTVIICGAGPTLRDHAADYEADEVWGCNSAAIWMHDTGHRITHAFTVDQTPAMVNEWSTTPDVEYLLASTVHPHLTAMLVRRNRRMRWFHNYVGINKPPVEFCECGHDLKAAGDEPYHNPVCTAEDCECTEYRPRRMHYEDWLYATLFPPTMRAGSGLNSVTRAVDVAAVMGFDKITVLGADCALKVRRPCPEGVLAGTPEHRRWLMTETEMHADGGHAMASGATGVTMGGEIDGRHWETKPDMVVSAVFLVKMKEKLGERLDLVGDTLPNALVGKPEEFLSRLPTLIGQDGRPLQFC